MADILVIVPPQLADGFRLGGARVWSASDPDSARDLLRVGLDDPDAGIIAVADTYLAALDNRTRRLIEQRYRPVVVGVPTRAGALPRQQRRAYLAELLRRAVGIKVVLGRGS
jgi:vacuolar-type H+-ATPase subunit F/Vma7